MISIPKIPKNVRCREEEVFKVISKYGWKYLRTQLSPEPITAAQEAELAENPPLPLPEVLAQILSELGPTYIKLGQLLSTRPDLLKPAYVEALESLQSDVPPVPWEQIKPNLEADLGGDLSEIFAKFDENPVAAGSLGQVYRAQLPEGQTVAVKVQRPGIREVIEADLQVLQIFVDRFKSRKLGKRFDLQGLLDEFSTSILNELNFEREARNTIELGANLDKSGFWRRGKIRVPGVYSELSSNRILVLEWVEGKTVLKADISSEQRVEVAGWLVQMIFNQFFIDGFFHADPHPGNFFFYQDESDYCLILLDCGMVSRFDPRTLNILLDLFSGIIEANPRRITQAIADIGFSEEPLNVEVMENEVDRLLRLNYSRSIDELKLGTLLQDILDIPKKNNIQLPGAIGLFLKALTNAEGVARSLDPGFSFVEVAGPVMKRAARKRYLNKSRARELTFRSVEALDSLSVLPRRVDTLLDRLETSDLRMSWTWQAQAEFQQTINQGVRNMSLALLSLGALGSGALLIAEKSDAASTVSGYTIFWGNGLLCGGLALAIWVVAGFIVRS